MLTSNEQTRARVDATRNFEKARRQALVQEISAKVTGRNNRLMPFEAIRAELRLQNPLYRGTREIPIAKIIGSVGRYDDFNRQFLPLTESMRERWVGVETLAVSSTGWPPIDVYQVGDAYFVRDGNHRTAVARSMGLPTIEAHIWEFPEDVEIASSDHLDEALIRIGANYFEQRTQLRELIPEADIRFTAPGRYSELLAQIERLREQLSEIDDQPISYAEAVENWYTLIYLPTIQIIHEGGLIENFPRRTQADLFVWLSRHRDQLGEAFSDYDNLVDLARALVERYKETGFARTTRQVRNLLGADELPPLVE